MTPELDRELWERIATVFERALDAGAIRRASLLDQLCGSDATVRREVEEMLAAHERGDGMLAERRLVDGENASAELGAVLAEGTRVGPYRVVEPIGAGGMGDVYRAERADGAYRQTVALKVLRPGYRTAEMVRRFRVEREALGRLVHPGIATILDGGTLDDGRPYIALQFVDGLPITTYCARGTLALRDRLALFVRVARIVQFAHGRLVVHRDIKPSNILVERDGTPRLLDFGIAKLLDPDTGGSLAVSTTPELRLLTPEYAAPEQLRGEAPSTAADVYALGVLLFEMLTGARPFAAAGRAGAALERTILETPAPAPSSAAATTAVARKLRGDLDRIVLMALRKEPERRYVSAAQLADDVERWLAGRPVVARPDSLRYRATKFVARNRALVAGGAALVLLVAGFGVTSSLQARRIAAERDHAERERVSAEDVIAILTGLFERADPNRYPGGDTVRVTSLLDDAEREVAGLADEPARQAALWKAVGRMRAARGEYARAIELLTKSYERRRALFGARDVEAARTRHTIAQVLVSYRGEAFARPLLDSSLAELRALLGEEDDDVRSATSDLLMATSDSLAARTLLARLMTLERKSPSRDPMAIAARLNARGAQREGESRHDEAAALFRASLDVLARHVAPQHEAARTVRRNLGAALFGAGRLAAAESLQRAAIVVEDGVPGALVTRGMAREALALTLAAEGRADSAEAHQRDALRLFREGMAPEHWRIWSALRNLAFIAGARGRTAEGLALLDSALAIARAGADSVEPVGYLTAQRIPFLVRLGRPGDAARALAEAERRLRASPAVSASHRADIHRYAGMLALAAGAPDVAADRFSAAVALAEPGDRPETPPGIHSCLLGVALVRLGRAAEAGPLLEKPCRRYRSGGLTDPLIVEWIDGALASVGAARPAGRREPSGR